ncbi:xanthine dehydrogenase family protein molybdopterin-binding subunit [Paraburkholderia sediminicola]|uniref:xanthine dehydrogenase family protein molybdopterin-binding subunit n=1 Tax=Paraburkholderia sediminicola TaxID=458836 RepID=UPI0038BAB67B
MTHDTTRQDPTQKDSAALSRVSRRHFLKTGVTLTGALLIGIAFPLVSAGESESGGAKPAAFVPNAFVRIDRDGTITLIMPAAEMGQGIFTGLSMVIAEELEVRLDQIRLEPAPSDSARFTNQRMGKQITAGSASMRGFWDPLRRAGAVARTLLVEAAARTWHVAPDSCRAVAGVVTHPSSGRQLAYGELVEKATRLPQPDPRTVKLKDVSDFKLVGTPAPRLDLHDKVNGRAGFGIDVQLPGLKVAAVAASPVLGGTVASLNERLALGVKGVRQVVRLESVVAVVADHTGAARKGLAALAVQWNDGVNGHVDSAELVRQLDLASQHPGAVARNDGDADAALASAARRLDAVYQVPFLAHATMEPLNCTVHLQADRCDIWIGTQAPARTQEEAAKAAGLPKERVVVHNLLMGGGFGRRAVADNVTQAVQIARHVDGPLKVIWSREEDIQHDYFRPYYFDRIAAGLDSSGKPVAWTHRFAGASLVALEPAYLKGGVDRGAVEGAATLPYSLPNLRVEFIVTQPPGVQTAFWRGVGPAHNVFVVESFMDELAAAAKQDPLQYRLALLGDAPRARAVLELAAKQGHWGAPLPTRWGRGIAVQSAFGGYAAQVAEVEVAEDGTLTVHRIVCAVDCGLVVNPDIVDAQVQGAVIYGLTAALYGEITFKDGRVEQGNFNDYRPLRIHEIPKIEVYRVAQGEAPGGAGEVGTPGVAPAIANAVWMATGKRLRKLPFDMGLLKV